MNRVLRCFQALGPERSNVFHYLPYRARGYGGMERSGIGREGKRGLVTIFDFAKKGNLRKEVPIFLSRLAIIHYNPSNFLRSDDGDGNKNVKKGIGSGIREQNKKTNKHTNKQKIYKCSTLFSHISLMPLQSCDVISELGYGP